MAAKQAGEQGLRFLLGVCMPSAKQNAAKIRVKRLGLDKNLLMYFNEYDFYYADDPEKLCKTGDTVLIQNLPAKKTRLVTHKVIRVIYPLGDVTDPITGKKVVADRYREHMEQEEELYGRSKNAFDYKKAPPRGSMENKRDFTSKETFYKYYDDPDNPQPYGV